MMKWLHKKPPQVQAEEIPLLEEPMDVVPVELPKKYRFRYSLLAKVLSFCCMIFMVGVAVISCIAAILFVDRSFYTETEERLLSQTMLERGQNVALHVVDYLDDIEILREYAYSARYNDLNAYCAGDAIAVSVYQKNPEQEQQLLYTAGELQSDSMYRFTYRIVPIYHQNVAFAGYSVEGVDETTYTPGGVVEELEYGYVVSLAFRTDMSLLSLLAGGRTAEKDLALTYCLMRNGYQNRYTVFANIGLALILAFLCFVHLVRAVAHRPTSEACSPSPWARIPLEVSTALFAVAGMVALIICDEIYADFYVKMALFVAAFLWAGALGLLYLLDLIARYKCGILRTNTLLYRMWALCKCGAVRGWHAGCALAKTLPLVQRGIGLFIGFTLMNLFIVFLFCSVGAWQLLLFVAVIEYLALFVAVVYVLLALRRLALGASALANGDLTYQLDSKHLYFELKDHAEHLNDIARGMTRALDARMKSERMKTELITNVSHDIKTPLTSIINYSDLLRKEETSNEKIIEYTGVIARQSERLKRLIEDLVEASKASSGNLDVKLAPCEVGVLLAQAIGEYETRMEEKNLALVVQQSEEPVMIMADGRRLWRVFDNLMNNIYKYTLEGTRVYFSVVHTDTKAMIVFRNISKYPLGITADELMERFVRGDASRHDEGNGLGLSIAQSLTELQHGTLVLSVDGDLFKVTLTFDLLQNET